MRSLAERFDSKIERIPFSGCWIWTGRVMERNGYGTLGRNLAHRISWKLHSGPIPKGLYVLHRCDVSCCVNPEHLFLGTQLDNVRDMMAKGRQNMGDRYHKLLTHCPHGHAYTAENIYWRGNHRACRACCLERSRIARERHRSDSSR